MPTLVIRNVDPATHRRLKARARAHGRSMEAEARAILNERVAVEATDSEMHWADAIRALVVPLGGIDLPEIERSFGREPPDFSGPDFGHFDADEDDAPGAA